MKKLNAGLVGCGEFARIMHVPNLMKSDKYIIKAVMDINEAAAKEMAEKTGAQYWTTDIDRLLSDGSIDIVFITTRHDSHAALTIRAADAGKHVFCEKPMALCAEDCKAITQAVARNGVKYTVGYNRGMAPMIIKAKNLLKDETHKKMIYHRIQAPFPEESWTHIREIGGGRFVGEGCHIFDLMCEIIKAPPVTVYASGGTFLNPEKVKIPDSGIVTISYADGSVATTLIASSGCSKFPKEATEIYCNEKAIYIENFKKMEYFGFEGQDSIVLEYGNIDKGQAIEIDELADAIINNTKSPNGTIKASRAAIISYKVNESIEKGIPVSIGEKDYIF